MSNEIFNQAINNLDTGNFDRALTKLDEAILNNVNVFQAMKLRAETNFYSSKFQSSVTSYQQIINKYPNSQVGYAGKALTLSVLGDFNQVERLYKSALNLNEKNWKVYACRAYSCTRMRKYEEAFEMYEKAITKNNLNDPISYIGRAQLFCVRKNFEACRKDIKYAKQAVNDAQNYKILYKFQVRQIGDSISEYQRVMGGLLQLQDKKTLSRSQREECETELTKQLNKSIMLNNQSIFKQCVSKIQRSILNASSMYQARDSPEQIIQQGAVPRVECPKCIIF